MFNIEFGSSNNSQKSVSWFLIDGNKQTLCVSPYDAEDTLQFLSDIRYMHEAEFGDIVMALEELAKTKE